MLQPPPADVASASTAVQSLFVQTPTTISQGSLDYVYTGSGSGGDTSTPLQGGSEGQTPPPGEGNANAPVIYTTMQFGGVSTLVVVDGGILLPTIMMNSQQ